MHIVIAGGAGFVGANLALALQAQYPSYRFTCLDNLSRKGSALNVPRLEAAGIRFVQADTRFADTLAMADKIEAVIDAAAEPSVLAGLQEGLDYLVQTNFNGTVNLLNLARQHGAQFIFLSTSRVYPIGPLCQLRYREAGNRLVLEEDQPYAGCSRRGISEDFPLAGSRSLYGATKLASELMVEEYRAFFGMQTVINRCGVIAGPWQMGKVDQGVIALWVAHHFWQKPLQYIGFGGRGLQVRDVLHIADLCRLIDWQLHHPKEVDGQLFNAGGGEGCSVSLAELTDHCRAITGNAVPITASATDRPGDIPVYLTDNSRVTAATGWAPQKTILDVLTDTLHWMQAHEALLRPVFAG